jgi:hypothetical protein
MVPNVCMYRVYLFYFPRISMYYAPYVVQPALSHKVPKISDIIISTFDFLHRFVIGMIFQLVLQHELYFGVTTAILLLGYHSSATFKANSS